MGKVIRFYETLDGHRPIREFLDSHPGKVAQRIAWVLRLLEEQDQIPARYFRKLQGSEEIWECRIQVGSNAYRIFCFFTTHSNLVLTHGILKKSQKTPRSEIRRAEVYRRDYLARREL